MNDQPIPNVAGKSLDLSTIGKEASPSLFLPLADANAKFGFIHCCECGVGGHTGHQLFTIIKDVTTGREAKACANHVGQYIRPKDLKKKRRR